MEAANFGKRKKNGRKEKALRNQGELTLRAVSLSPWKLLLERNGFRAGRGDHEMYSLIKFEPLHNLHLGILKMLKECMVSYPSSRSMLIISEREVRKETLCCG